MALKRFVYSTRKKSSHSMNISNLCQMILTDAFISKVFFLISATVIVIIKRTFDCKKVPDMYVKFIGLFEPMFCFVLLPSDKSTLSFKDTDNH